MVDPGPRDPAHVESLLRALDSETVRTILITHTHGDHSPAAAALHDATGAPVLGFGPHPKDATSEEADADDETEPGEETTSTANAEAHRPDIDFDPETRLAHGDTVEGPGWTVQALHTPGHISNHLCFALAEENAVLTGDHVMGWSTTIIPPPDGDVADYLKSLQLLLDRSDEVLYPTHGGPVNNPQRYVSALLNHRLSARNPNLGSTSQRSGIGEADGCRALRRRAQGATPTRGHDLSSPTSPNSTTKAEPPPPSPTPHPHPPTQSGHSPKGPTRITPKSARSATRVVAERADFGDQALIDTSTGWWQAR